MAAYPHTNLLDTVLFAQLQLTLKGYDHHIVTVKKSNDNK